LGLVLVLSLFLVAGQNISVSYPSSVDYGEEFSFEITLINFSIDVYDIKIYITNSSNNSIAEIWDGSDWITSYQYVNDIINTSESNISTFQMNITKIWDNNADIEITIKDSSNNREVFSGYTIDVDYEPSDDPPEDENEVGIDLDYGDEVRNGIDFSVDVDLEDLENMDYDIKVYIEDEDDRVISETYHESEDDWKSSNYYVDEIVTGSGDESITFQLRIKDDYEDFSGDVKIKAKVRETSSENTVAEFEGDITILEKEEEDNDEPPPEEDDSNDDTEDEEVNEEIDDSGVIRLNIPQQESIKTKETSVFYKSKLEYMREYGIYGFAFMCIIIIFILLRSV
jgi:hypothetical protein